MDLAHIWVGQPASFSFHHPHRPYRVARSTFHVLPFFRRSSDAAAADTAHLLRSKLL